MMNMQWSIVLIVLSTLQIYTSYGQCPADLDLCPHVSCGNGTCVRNSTIQNCFQCICNTGFTGAFCETNLEATCPESFCQNGGNCSMNGNVPICACPSTHTGYICEIPITTVSSTPLATTEVPSTTATLEVTTSTASPVVGTCTVNPCLNGGQCISYAGNSICICAAGYMGSLCDSSVSTTTDVPSTTLTTTTDVPSTTPTTTTEVPSTTATATVTISTTTSIVGTCAVNPCLNGGQCISYAGNSICICAAGYTGPLCDLSILSTTNVPSTTPTTTTSITTTASIIGICAVNPCLNGGVCLSTTNSFICVCGAAYTGTMCEMSISSTTGVPTTSLPTTTGISTTIPNSCSSKPCYNGGTCYNTGNSFFCFCRPQYTGQFCELQNLGTTVAPSTAAPVDACASSPCNNGGTCYRHGSSFFCLCSTYYTGLTCDTVKTFTTPSVTTPNSAVTCANQPCQNGATCYTTGNSYFCYCGSNSNYAGKNCDTLKVPNDPNCPLSCSPGQCVRSGDTRNPYVCMCNGVLQLTSCSQ